MVKRRKKTFSSISIAELCLTPADEFFFVSFIAPWTLEQMLFCLGEYGKQI
jgi:hypothetical protein